MLAPKGEKNMEWIACVNRALTYVEEHLTDETLSIVTVARAAAYSPFYLQRLFYVLTGMSLSDYIRQRRLSVAGQELQFAGGKVIDAAFKYGYETPESFQKAFRRFHGVTPSLAQRTHVQLRYLNPLQIHVELRGGSLMDYAVENLGELTIVGMERKIPYEKGFEEAPKFWSDFNSNGGHRLIRRAMGICFDDEGLEFTYMIGGLYEPGDSIPEGFTLRTVAAHTWAKFKCVGPIPEAIQQVNRQIFTEWLPNNTDYDLAEGVNIEYYPEGNMQTPEYECEIWIPLRVKK
jgi:AraC family transcriptional regulator